MLADLEISGCSIVLLGKFNPAIFHPSWLERHKVITDSEAAESDLQVTHPDIAQMVIGPLVLTVEQQRCTVRTSAAPFVRVADFVGQVFGSLLPHTPLEQAGINFQRHYRLASAEARHALGRRLAPVEPWGAWGKRLDETTVTGTRNGVQTIAMRELWEDKPWAGWMQVKIEPSTQIGHERGVYIDNNYHIRSLVESFDSTDLVQYILRRFDDVRGDANWIDEQILRDAG